MYSNIGNVQYLIAGLKAYGINTVVVSPGNSHNAIVRSMEEDPFFTTYNIVDERSAAFFACGLSQELCRPVIILCTAGTAAVNYLSGVTEASRREIPLVVITGDKNPYYLGQYEDQMIDNMGIFRGAAKYQCALPMIRNDKDRWFCCRVINEALLELDHRGKGPVHINVPIEEGVFAIGDTFTSAELPSFPLIGRIRLNEDRQKASELFSSLKNKRIFLICGQDDHITGHEKELIGTIAGKYNCVFAVDKLSNLHVPGTVEVAKAARRHQLDLQTLWPDVIVSFAGNPCMDVKFQFKNANRQAEHWIVNESGRIADPFKKLTVVLEGTVTAFLETLAEAPVQCDTHEYLQRWKEETDKVVCPDTPYSNMYSVRRLMSRIPAGSNLHIANSSTVRIAQYFDVDDSVSIYCNRGVNGIDGCVSTFIGQAAASPDRMNFLIVGDLAFFYDMNSVWNRYVGKNVRILLNNNEGAALFHLNQGLSNYPTLNRNIAAEHHATAKGWIESRGFLYLCAHNQEEFDKNLELFMNTESDRPVFFEVFTHKEKDAETMFEFYNAITLRDAATARKSTAKKMLKNLLGDEVVKKIRDIR